MWKKITSIKSKTSPVQESESGSSVSSSSSQPRLLDSIFNPRPDISAHQPPRHQQQQEQSVQDVQTNSQYEAEIERPTSPSKKSMFKRLSRQHLNEVLAPPAPIDDPEQSRPSSPLKFLGLPKKVKSTLSLMTNGSQASLSRISGETVRSPTPTMTHLPSFDALRRPRTSQDTYASSISNNLPPLPATPDPTQTMFARRPSSSDNPESMNADMIAGSVRSILRDPNTPGTGQNVRFFSRDAYKVISPEQSMDTSSEPPPTINALTGPSTAPAPATVSGTPFLDRVQQVSSSLNAPSSSNSGRVKKKKGRPSATEVFSPLREVDTVHESSMEISAEDASRPPGSPFAPPQGGGPSMFDLAGLELPPLPEGLGDFLPDEEQTSTPYRADRVKNKLEDTVFHSIDKSTPEKSAAPEGTTIFYSEAETSFASMNSSSSSAKLKGHKSQPSLASSVSSHLTNLSQISEADSSTSSRLSRSRSSTNSLLGRSLKPKYAVKPEKAAAAKSRSRALSDTVFQSFIRSSTSSAESSAPPPTPPEGDIHDESASSLVVYTSSPQASPGKADPFSAHANTYYTPGTPPRVRASSPSPMNSLARISGRKQHARNASKEESLIFSLQTQLTMRTEICAQFEADLVARDELVDTMSKKLAKYEEEDTHRKHVLRKWKKRVGDLERMVRHLEEEVDNSRQDSLERSIMDEASGEALRMLHRRIGELEREKERSYSQVQQLEESVAELQDDVGRGEERERMLRAGIADAHEQIEMMGNISLNMSIGAISTRSSHISHEATEERKAEAQQEWAKVQETAFDVEREKLGNELSSVRGELEEALASLSKTEQEFSVVKQELEAQWCHTEAAAEKSAALENENSDLRETQGRLEAELVALKSDKQALIQEKEKLAKDVAELEEKVAELENGWTETEHSRERHETDAQELEVIRETMEKERETLEEQLAQERQHTDGLTQALQDREDQFTTLEQQHKYTLENVARLEKNLEGLDEELTSTTQMSSTHQVESEALREQLSALQRTQSHAASDQSRQLQEALEAQKQSQEQLKDVIKSQVQAETQIGVMQAGMKNMDDELEALRRQVRQLKQESADKEVKLVQADKQRRQDKEDKEGLNMALDSKQTELELLKRKLGVRGTAGSTPAPASKIASRRDSAVFSATPAASGSRPSSVASDISSTAAKEPSSVTKKDASGRLPALRTSTARSSMGPPAPRTSLSSAPGTTPRASAASSRISAPRPSIGTPTPAGGLRSSIGLGRAPSSGGSTVTKPSTLARKPLTKVTRQPSVDEKENELGDESMASDAPSKRRLATPL